MKAVRRSSRRFRTAFVAVLAIASASMSVGCTSAEPSDEPSTEPSIPASETYAPSLGIDQAQFTALSSDVLYRDLTVGTGAEATVGKTISVTYTGFLPNGKEFESNADTSPFEFALGTGYVVQGWDLGIVGMRVGGKRRLLIGSNAGYGPTGSGPIPPNSTMIFDITLLSVK